jgi:DNA polymerase III delta subunit
VLLGSLASHFRKLVRVNGGGAVAGPPFLIRKLEQQARRYSAVRLRGCMEAIHQTDLAIKGAGALSPELALERLVLVLAG